MHNDGDAPAEGAVTVARVPTDVYKQHLASMLGSLSLGEDVGLSLMATLDRNGEVRVMARGQTAAGDLIVSIDVEPDKGLVDNLRDALDDATEAVRAELKLGIATNLVAMRVESGELS